MKEESVLLFNLVDELYEKVPECGLGVCEPQDAVSVRPNEGSDD